MNGKIKAFYGNFGFIAPSDGSPDVFFHIGQVQPGVSVTPLGADVTYALVDNELKPGKVMAANVRALHAEAPVKLGDVT